MHLWHAPKRICVLDAWIAEPVRLADLAVFEELQEERRRLALSGLAAHVLERGSKATGVPSRASTDMAPAMWRHAPEPAGLDQRQRRGCRVGLRAVDRARALPWARASPA